MRGRLATAIGRLWCVDVVQFYATVARHAPALLTATVLGQCVHHTADQFIVKAIVELARGLGKQAIAEFVGDAETAVLLQEYGVDLSQGYFIGKPVPRDAQNPLSTAQVREAGPGVTA